MPAFKAYALGLTLWAAPLIAADPKALLQEAAQAVQRGEHAAAVAIYDRYLKAQPGDARVRDYRDRLAQRLGAAYQRAELSNLEVVLQYTPPGSNQTQHGTGALHRAGGGNLGLSQSALRLEFSAVGHL